MMHFFETTSVRGRRYAGYVVERPLPPRVTVWLSAMFNLLSAVWGKA